MKGCFQDSYRYLFKRDIEVREGVFIMKKPLFFISSVYYIKKSYPYG